MLGRVSDVTGSVIPETRLVTVPFGPYEITVELTAEGTFLRVVSIAVSKEFMSPEQGLGAAGAKDLAEYYRDEK